MLFLYRSILKVMPYVFIGLLILVTYLLLMEMPPAPPSWPYKDKVQHIVVFLALSISGGLAFQKRCAVIYIILAGYGALMEVLQSLLTVTRVASVYDWIADATGILLAWLMLQVIMRYLKNKGVV